MREANLLNNVIPCFRNMLAGVRKKLSGGQATAEGLQLATFYVGG